MALVLVISKDSISQDGSTVKVVDSTGDYDVNDNPGGYGTPNPDRTDLALFIRSFSKRVSEDDIQLEVSTYDPETADEWDITLSKDGWQQVIVYGLRLYSTSLNLSIGELVYNTATEEIFKILTKSGSGPYTYTYEVVTIEEVEETGVTVAYEGTLNTLIVPGLDKCLSSANSKYFSELEVNTKSKPCEDNNFNQYLKIDAYLKAIAYDFAAGNYTASQEMVEQVEKLCSCFIENCSC
jgi:hypothetical protein